MKYFILFSLASLLILFSCRKDTGRERCKRWKDSPDFITMGNLDGMLYESLEEKIQGGYNVNENYGVDVDNDHVPDFEIAHQFSGSLAVGTHPYATIKCIGDSTYIGVNATIDTTYQYLTIGYSGSNPVQKTVSHHHNCIPAPGIHSIVSVKDRPANRVNDEDFFLSDEWTSDDQTLISNSYAFPPSLNTTNQDTTICHLYIYEYTCKNPTGTVYIPIKKLRCGEMKLGWIKLTFPDNWSSVTIDEVAIQE